MSIYDSRSDLQKSIDQYVYVLQVAAGEKNPVRRKAFEADVAYALEAVLPFKERFERILAYDIFAADDVCDTAVEKINAALEVLHRIGAADGLPVRIENPRVILAECAMTLVDTLRALNAFDAGAVEVLIGDVLREFGPETVSRLFDTPVKVMLHRYIHDKIPDSVLDKIAVEDAALYEYLKLLP